MDLKKIGGFLKEVRKEKGMTQEQLAETLGVSGRTISRWETGANMPDLSILIVLADYYGIEIKDILDGERKSEVMDHELKETLSKVAGYSELQKERARGIGNLTFGVMFAVCAAVIVIQMVISADFKLVFGETVVLVVGGIAYIVSMVHYGIWETGSGYISTPWHDIVIGVTCSGLFSVIFALCLFQLNAGETQIMKLSFAFFVGITILGFIGLRILAFLSRKREKCSEIRG